MPNDITPAQVDEKNSLLSKEQSSLIKQSMLENPNPELPTPSDSTPNAPKKTDKNTRPWLSLAADAFSNIVTDALKPLKENAHPLMKALIELMENVQGYNKRLMGGLQKLINPEKNEKPIPIDNNNSSSNEPKMTAKLPSNNQSDIPAVTNLNTPIKPIRLNDTNNLQQEHHTPNINVNEKPIPLGNNNLSSSEPKIAANLPSNNQSDIPALANSNTLVELTRPNDTNGLHQEHYTHNIKAQEIANETSPIDLRTSETMNLTPPQDTETKATLVQQITITEPIKLTQAPSSLELTTDELQTPKL